MEAEARREAPRVAAAEDEEDRRRVVLLLLPLGRAQGVAAARTEARHCIFFFFGGGVVLCDEKTQKNRGRPLFLLQKVAWLAMAQLGKMLFYSIVDTSINLTTTHRDEHTRRCDWLTSIALLS